MTPHREGSTVWEATAHGFTVRRYATEYSGCGRMEAIAILFPGDKEFRHEGWDTLDEALAAIKDHTNATFTTISTACNRAANQAEIEHLEAQAESARMALSLATERIRAIESNSKQVPSDGA